MRTVSQILEVYSALGGSTSECSIMPDGTIGSVAPRHSKADFSGCFVTEGLVDLQVNGFAGVDFNRPGITAEQLDFALAEMARTGVTSLLPTIITGRADIMVETLRSIDDAVSRSRLGPLMVKGYHVEGPFLSGEDGYSGAHSSEFMTAANIDLVDEIQSVASRPIRIMTVAPEVAGVIGLIQDLVARGIQVAIGHSAAKPDQIRAAIRSGATLSTHLGNGLPGKLHKTENPIFWQLAEDELTAMFIADGIHLPRAALQTMLRAKGLLRSILTTDAVAAAGLRTPPGTYTLGKTEIELSEDRSVRIPGSAYLAGSSVTMDQMVRNMVDWYDYSIPQILEMTQLNPARLLGFDVGNFATDQPVQFVEWRPSSGGLRVARTHIGKFTIE